CRGDGNFSRNSTKGGSQEGAGWAKELNPRRKGSSSDLPNSDDDGIARIGSESPLVGGVGGNDCTLKSLTGKNSCAVSLRNEQRGEKHCEEERSNLHHKQPW